MGTSPDVGGRSGLGRPLQPEYSELEASAQTQVAKQDLAIAKHTDDISFTQFGGDTWRYEAHAPKPSLQAKVLVAITHPEPSKPSPLEEENFKRLIEELPLKLSMELKKERKLPFEKRDGRFVVFEQILRFMAKALAWGQEVQNIDIVNHQELASKFAAGPRDALFGWIDMAKEVLEEYLDDDGNRDCVTTILKSAELLKKMHREKQNRLAKQLLEEANTLLKAYRMGKREELDSVVAGLIGSFIPICASLTVKQGSAAHFGLAFSRESPFGSFIEQFVDETFPKNIGKLLIQITPLLIYSAAGIKPEGQGVSKIDKLFEKSQMRTLAMQLAATVVLRSEFITHAGYQLLSEQNIPTEKQKTLIELAIALGLNAMIVTADVGTKEVRHVAPLFEALRPHLEELLNRLKTKIELMETGPLKKAFQVAVRSSLLAAKQGGVKEYLDAIKGCLPVQKLQYVAIQGKSRKLSRLALSLLQEFYHTREQEQFTNVLVQPA